MSSAYNYHWHTATRLRILRRAFGRFTCASKGRERYIGYAKCERCGHIDCMHGGRSELDVAHLVILPGDPGHDADDNLAALCRPCHRKHDYKSWASKFRAWLADRNDAMRPILAYLKEAV